MVTEGELRNNSLDDSDKVKELQDKVADLKAEVGYQIDGNTIRVLKYSTSTLTSQIHDSFYILKYLKLQFTQSYSGG